ncbi:alpha/beta fold hydrolase [Cryptosporangium phraense]|uniref:Alpha/beta fold hydrolase n=1 Tax=Cryptosporangium phraense TaxID=2593070 RepID=A0A545AP33_9ACTN|nr:alpha/beta fold hydrolase [Cryptosporangium phraense]TQS43011.1 alpha/beta fold hydrolase [Cryptosporangium phraense]
MATYLLVHGAWHSAEAWTRVIPLLEQAGHRVVAPDLTGYGTRSALLGPDVGLDTHVDDVLRTLAENDLTDVILVGHSYAGMVITSVADRAPERIAQLVFLDAMVPEDGESALDVMPFTQVLIDAAGSWRIPPLPETPGGLFGVTDPADVAWLRTMLADQPVECLRQPAHRSDPAAARIPRTHIHCTVGAPERRPVPASDQIWELPTGHDCMITTPVELAGLLGKLAA